MLIDKGRSTTWITILAVLLTFGFTTTAAAQRLHGGAGNNGARGWVILTYVGDAGPFAYPAIGINGGGVAFDFFSTPDRAMLITDISDDNQFRPGKLIGKTLSARVAISATSGATFNYYNTGGTLPASVRLYFQRPDAPGCPASSEFDPNYPQCEAQYWWSNPVHIELAALAALNSGKGINEGITLEAPLSPEFWSDRDGHMGDSDAAHIAWFNDAVAHANKIAVSFGGGNNFAFGCGVDGGPINPGPPPATYTNTAVQATFKLLKYMVKN